MDTNDLLFNYKEERECEYKDRKYLARDNGSVLRLPKESGRTTKLDNVWTFGVKNEENGYMVFTGNIRVHQIVCTAFHGPAPNPFMVVDHIDTNRCNNRPENLRWLTRLENALNNPYTRQRIIYHFGSVENFLKDPSKLSEIAGETNISWMRTVSKEEAEKCLKHLEEWKAQDQQRESSGEGIGEWIYEDQGNKMSVPSRPRFEFKSKEQREAEIAEASRRYREENFGLKDSLTPGAQQLKWKTPTEFLLCPMLDEERTLECYLGKQEKGKPFLKNTLWSSEVQDAGINHGDDALYVLTHQEKAVKPWAICRITYQDDAFIHESYGTYFKEDGGLKYFTIALGKEWTGGDVFDDFC